MNSTGQTVLDNEVDSNSPMIDLSGNARGIYYIKITHNSGIKTERIIFR
jgi:hypothetical protein